MSKEDAAAKQPGTDGDGGEEKQDYASRLGLEGEQAALFRSLSTETQEHLFVHIGAGMTILHDNDKGGAHGTINLDTGKVTKSRD